MNSFEKNRSISENEGKNPKLLMLIDGKAIVRK
jgi:hypothetical protein